MKTLSSLIFAAFLLSVPIFYGNAQDSTDYVLKKSMDSIRSELEVSLRAKTIELKGRIETESRVLSGRIDSLESELKEQKKYISELEEKYNNLEKHVDEANLKLDDTRELLTFEGKRFRNILMVTVPSLIFLIVLSSFLLYILIMRQREDTDRKMASLRKYTSQEIEETKEALLKRLRKRVRKVSKELKKRTGKTQ